MIEEQESLRSGASLEDDLPLLVWLQGDEPYFEEFILDAEKVMEMLGIKRSRLTQISGRELRVGRTKIGRYVRPVYRQKDVEDYIDWVTPTSSHKKSGDYIEEASSRLEQMAEFFVGQLNSQTVNWPEKFKKIAENFYHGHYELVEKSELRLTQIEQKMMEISASSVTFLKKKIEGVENLYQGLNSRVEDLSPVIHGVTELLKHVLTLSQEVKELKASSDRTQSQFALLLQEFQQSKHEIHVLTKSLENFCQEFKEKQEQDKQKNFMRKKETYIPYSLNYRDKKSESFDNPKMREKKRGHFFFPNSSLV